MLKNTKFEVDLKDYFLNIFNKEVTFQPLTSDLTNENNYRQLLLDNVVVGYTTVYVGYDGYISWYDPEYLDHGWEFSDAKYANKPDVLVNDFKQTALEILDNAIDLDNYYVALVSKTTHRYWDYNEEQPEIEQHSLIIFDDNVYSEDPTENETSFVIIDFISPSDFDVTDKAFYD